MAATPKSKMTVRDNSKSMPSDTRQANTSPINYDRVASIGDLLLSNAKRLRVITELANGEKNVGELCLALGLPQAELSGILRVMRLRKVVEFRKSGQHNVYTLQRDSISELFALIDIIRS